MLIAFDVGNSSVSIGVFELLRDQQPVLRSSFKISNKPYSSDEYSLYINDFLLRSGFIPFDKNGSASHNTIDRAVISSVVPSLTPIIKKTARDLSGHDPFIISSGTKTGFGIKIKNPSQLGSDIVCNVAAALSAAKPPLVVLDMGTATTITVVNKESLIIGTIIAPGLAVSLNALTDSAALLQNVTIDEETALIGRDTDESISSGVINGSKFMIDGFLRNIREQLIPKGSDEHLSLVATGGLANNVISHTKNKFTYYENLTLSGEALLYLNNVHID